MHQTPAIALYVQVYGRSIEFVVNRNRLKVQVQLFQEVLELYYRRRWTRPTTRCQTRALRRGRASTDLVMEFVNGRSRAKMLSELLRLLRLSCAWLSRAGRQIVCSFEVRLVTGRRASKEQTIRGLGGEASHRGDRKLDPWSSGYPSFWYCHVLR